MPKKEYKIVGSKTLATAILTKIQNHRREIESLPRERKTPNLMRRMVKIREALDQQ